MQSYYSQPCNYGEEYPPSHGGSGGGKVSPPWQQPCNYGEEYPPSYGGGGGEVSPPPPPWQQQYQNIYTPSQSSRQNAYGTTHQSQMQQASSSLSSYSMAKCLPAFGSDPFCEIKPSAFPPGTDPKVVEIFKRIDRDGNGVVDDRELQAVLSSACSHTFNLRTVHLLMYEFTHSNKRAIGPREFIPLLNCLQKWRTMFQRFDRDRNGSIDSMELGHALNSLGYCVSPNIVNLLIAKFTNSSGNGRCSLQYDQFIECCLTIEGLTETFKAKEDICGKATFGYEEFLLNVLPFIIA